MTPPPTRPGDIIRVDKSWAFDGIMNGSEFEATHVMADGDHIGVSNGAFFGNLHFSKGDRWTIIDHQPGAARNAAFS